MIGNLFRIVQFVIYLAVFTGLVVGAYCAVTWIIRLGWTAFELNHKEQAAWLRSKLPKRRKKRRSNANKI
jgi:hypothetical protein